MAGVVVLDAGALIALFQDTDVHHKWATDFAIITIESEMAVSAVTLSEAMVHPARAGLLDQYRASIEALEISVSGFDASSASQVAQLRATTGLKTPDAVVLQKALELQAEIATTDQTLAKRARELSIGVFQPN